MTANKDIRLCFVGDSFVNGTGDTTTLGWAGRLCVAAAASGLSMTYYNLGVRRDTSDDVWRRWREECARRLPSSCDARIVFSFGVNDMTLENGKTRIDLETSCANLGRLLVDARKYLTLVVGPPPIDDDRHNDRIKTLSDGYAVETARAGIPYISLHAPLASDRDYLQDVATNDGAHPTHRGYRKIAAIVGASAAWWFNDSWNRYSSTPPEE